MKEAAGEANMTVVTIILITVVVAVVTPIITSMMNNTGYKTCCMNAGGTKVVNGQCQGTNGDTSAVDTSAYDQCLLDSGVKKAQ